MKRWQRAVYLAPALLLVTVFFIVPFFYLLYVSFFEWNGLGPMVFKGLGNYEYVLKDPLFRTAVKNTLVWIGAAVLLHVPLGMLLALLLHRKPRGWKLMRIMYFIPNVISTTAVAFMWYFIYHVDVGLINAVLEAVGLGSLTHGWLNSLDTALGATLVPFVMYVGLTCIIFLTQLSTISPELYEAAELDGATGWRKDIHVSIPLLKPALVTNLFLNVAFCLRTFEYPFLMTGGGPAGSTTNLSLYIYKEMMNANRYGISMVAGLFTVLMGAAVMGVVMLLNRERKEDG